MLKRSAPHKQRNAPGCIHPFCSICLKVSERHDELLTSLCYLRSNRFVSYCEGLQNQSEVMQDACGEYELRKQQQRESNNNK